MDETINRKCVFCKKELFRGKVCPICRKKILTIIVAVIASIIITVVLATGTIAYILFPTDIIPDFVPILGQSDDAAITALLFLTWLSSISPVIAIPIIIFKNN